MALYDKASLVLIPSGTKEGVVFSQKPTNGDGDFTFSRSTAATRVNADGLIEKETQNLLLQSNTFSNASWNKTNSSVTAGQSGYDGSSDAWQVDISASFAQVEQTISTSGVQTFSLYAKAGTLNWVRLRVDHSTFSGTYFDLANGAVGSTASDIDSSIEDVGGGWYRCSLTFNDSITKVRIYPAQANNDLTATSGNIYIQDAQLEEGLVARDYIETTTAAVYGGITDNVPRLDYTGGATCPSLLLEPTRSNLVDYSEYASGNSSASAPTLVENYAISPEGLQNAFQISTDAGTFRRMRKTLTGLSGNNSYSMSVFVKKATSAVSTYGGLGMVWQGGTQKVNYIIFDEYNGTMSILQDQTSNISTKVDDVGDYWRFSVGATDTGTNTSFEAAYYACLSSTGSTIGTGVKSWVGYGLQLEAGSYATSYIPTYGTSVTFAKDFCYGAGNASTFNSEEGVFYFEGSALANDGTNRYLSIDDGTTSNYIYFRYVSTSNNILFRTAIAGVTINTLSTSLPDTTQNHKFAFKWKSGDYAFWIDGVEVGTDTSSTIFSPNVLSNIEFSFPTDGGGGFASNTRQIMIFNTALTDAELIALTTI
jgi:hypothetical protein